MTLGELISTLEKENADRVLSLGFHYPHSYRGYYERLAFIPKNNVSIGDMLHAAKTANGTTYTGYKGGDYKMDLYSEVYLAEWGDCGEELGPTLLKLMLANEAQP